MTEAAFNNDAMNDPQETVSAEVTSTDTVSAGTVSTDTVSMGSTSDLELFEQYLDADTDFDLPERGDLREGVIVEIRPHELLVNVGSKRDGVVPQSDLSKLDPAYVAGLEEGQTVDVVVSRQSEDDGAFQLSIADALQQRDWIPCARIAGQW